MSGIEIIGNGCAKSDCSQELALMSRVEIEKAAAFHRSFPQYAETPLVRLDGLASRLGIKGIY
ncbi:MAG: diaminopropionate ammonia-lyase, partial [Treponema sp.]|nr:diaminopropionate ammonia-lyase [Treponema sp.]